VQIVGGIPPFAHRRPTKDEDAAPGWGEEDEEDVWTVAKAKKKDTLLYIRKKCQKRIEKEDFY
jgi:hypothetical protein